MRALFPNRISGKSLIRQRDSWGNLRGGYSTVEEGVLAQYKEYSEEYSETLKGRKHELLGFGIDRNGRFYFTDMLPVPKQFEASVQISKQDGDTLAWASHTHPDKSGFSGVDYETPNTMKIPSFVRGTSSSAVYRWDPSGASEYRRHVDALRRAKAATSLEDEVRELDRWGIKNICSERSNCL